MRVLVLMGGVSAEREVSLHTGAAVAEALEEAGHSAETYDLHPVAGRDVMDLLSFAGLRRADVVFIALHGGEGEDGRIQAMLDLIGKPYTGSGVRASAICMDKSVSKIIFERHGISTPPWSYLRDGASDVSSVDREVEGLGGPPVVVKPVDQGSTIGISIVQEAGQLPAAIALALQYSPCLVLERYIEGKELSVPILGEDVLPMIEIKPKDGFYDYERKYTKGMTVYECPAKIEPDIRRRIDEDALKAFRILGCEGFARVDLRLGVDGVPYFLEVNTIPGMTETSLVPMGARAKGISFPQLVDRIASYAMRRAGMNNAKAGG